MKIPQRIEGDFLKTPKKEFPDATITTQPLKIEEGKQVLKDGNPILLIGADREAKSEGEFHGNDAIFARIISEIAAENGGIL